MFHTHDTDAWAPEGSKLRSRALAAGRHLFRGLAASGGQPQIPLEPVDERLTDSFMDAMAELVSGLCVVTASGPDGAPYGLVATSLCAYSADPPAILLCLARHGRARAAVASAPAFGVHVLCDEQEQVARWFATNGNHKFSAVDWEWDHGVPAMSRAHVVAYLRCARAAVKRHGDHAIVIGHVVHAETAPGEPLVYLRRRMGWRLDDAVEA